MANSLILLVPGAGIEPARHIVPRDFKSVVPPNHTSNDIKHF
jgi:hypothetical protein